MFGEVLNHSDALCASYVGPSKLDSVLDYPLYFKTKNVFAKASGNTKQLDDHYAAVAANYDALSQMRLVTFLDNHDQPRFLSRGQANNNTNLLKVALVFLYTSPGIPCLYYGTEQAFNGETDPYDREDMFAGQFKDGPSGVDSFNETHPLFQFVARLNNLRRLYPALTIGAYANVWNDKLGPGLFAYTRRLDGRELIVVFNTAKTNQVLPACPTICAPNTKLVNLLDPAETAIVQSGSQTAPITVPGESAKIFIAQSAVRPLDPIVTAISPAHDSRQIKTNSPIIIQFSQPMNPDSAEFAFSITPFVHGTFSWSSANDTMTFTPQASGFPASTTVLVHLGFAQAASGQLLTAPFYSQFKTQGIDVQR